MLSRFAIRILSLALLLGGAGCSRCDSDARAAGRVRAGEYLGTWTGTCDNTTFDSSGAVTITVMQNGAMFSANLAMDGSVFGGPDAAADTFSATVTSARPHVFEMTSSVYGKITGSLAEDGTLTVQGSGIRGRVDRFAVTGTWYPNQITANLTFTFDDATVANSTATLGRQ